MTAIELYYSSLPHSNHPYCREDEDDSSEPTELEVEAEWEYYLLNSAGIRNAAFPADYSDF